MRRYLILGAGGFIGKSLTLKLSNNCHIKAFDNKIINEFQDNENIEMIVGDFNLIDKYGGLFDNVDVVIHLISTTIPVDNTIEIPLEIENNIIPTVKLLECMVKNDVSNIIFASSGGTIYGNKGDYHNIVGESLEPISSYGVQKLIIEEYIKLYGRLHGLKYKIARISNPYGLGQNLDKMQGVIPIFINNLLLGKDIKIYGDGETIRDYIYLDDLIDALIALDKYNGKINTFNVGSGSAFSLKEILEIIQQICRLDFPNIHIDEMRKHDIFINKLQVNETFKELKWKPKYEIHDGIKYIYETFKSKK